MALPPLTNLELKQLPYSVQEYLRQIRNIVNGAAGSGVLFTSLTFTASNITSILTRNHDDLQNLSGGTSGQYFHLTSAQSTDVTNYVKWTSWTPTRTGWTDVGSPTVTARYNRVNNIVHFQIKVVPGTTTATVAGTSYVSLPISANASGICGDVEMMNLTTLVGVGSGVIDVPNSRAYVPSQGATGNTLTISGWYEV